jgi:outer membrane receptor protein involved in Fe transport
MKHTYTLLISLIIPLFSSTLFAQTIEGFVLDNQTNESIPGVTIRFNNEGVVSDIDGSFSIPSSTKIVAIFSYPEYETDTVELVTGVVNYIKLNSVTEETDLGPVVVAASRRKQKLEEVTVSMDVISDELIANKGITDLKQAVDQTPGAYVMDGQVSIRGGSGFSYGAGSRVLILWNETPLLTADAGDPKWNAIPIESAQQIEVIKGASSVLYGSGALNGIVSMIEKEPGVEPSLAVKIQSGIYDNPMRESLKWWTKSPMQYQGDVSYGKQYKRFGLNLGAAGFTTSGFRQGETEDRVRINGTVFWRPKQVKKITKKHSNTRKNF